jgi:hypothetical protein
MLSRMTAICGSASSTAPGLPPGARNDRGASGRVHRSTTNPTTPRPYAMLLNTASARRGGGEEGRRDTAALLAREAHWDCREEGRGQVPGAQYHPTPSPIHFTSLPTHQRQQQRSRHLGRAVVGKGGEGGETARIRAEQGRAQVQGKRPPARAPMITSGPKSKFIRTAATRVKNRIAGTGVANGFGFHLAQCSDSGGGRAACTVHAPRYHGAVARAGSTHTAP